MSVPQERAAVRWRLPLLAGAFLFLCYLLTFAGTIAPKNSDGRAMYLVTRSLVDRHDVAIVPDAPGEVAVAPGWRPLPIPTGPCATEPAVNGIGERKRGPYYAKYGIGQSLLAVPFYLLGSAVARGFAAIDRAEVTGFVTSAYNPAVTALTAILLCALALRLGWSRRVALGLALLFGLATPAWAYTTSFFSEPTIALCLLGAVAAVLWQEGPVTPRAGAAAGAWLAVALLTHLADSALYFLVFAVYVLACSPRERRMSIAAAFTAPLALGLAITMGYDLARFGSVLRTGYGIVGDQHDLHPPHTLRGLWDGLYGPLLSPGKGLFLYAPVLLLAPWAWFRFARRHRAAAWLCLGLCVAAVLGHANTLIVWLGGWAWGPRFLIPILPVALLPLGSLLQEAGAVVRALTWLLGALGVLIQVPGVLLDYGAYINYLKHQTGCIWRAEDLYKWHPEYSPLIGQWQRLLDPHTYEQAKLTNLTTMIGQGRFTAAPHPWWSLLAAQGASIPLLGAIVAAIGLAAVLMLAFALRIAGPRAPEVDSGGWQYWPWEGDGARSRR